MYIYLLTQDSPLRIAYQCCPPSDCRRLRFSVTADFMRLINYYIIIIIIIVEYPMAIHYIKFEHFGIISFLSYAADKQTDRQTDRQTERLERLRPTHADRHSQNA